MMWACGVSSKMRDNITGVGDPDHGNVVGRIIFANKVEGDGEGMSVTEGVHEYEFGPGLVANHEGEGPEGHDQRYLTCAG